MKAIKGSPKQRINTQKSEHYSELDDSEAYGPGTCVEDAAAGTLSATAVGRKRRKNGKTSDQVHVSAILIYPMYIGLCNFSVQTISSLQTYLIFSIK